jgi:hypothetical protein
MSLSMPDRMAHTQCLGTGNDVIRYLFCI